MSKAPKKAPVKRKTTSVKKTTRAKAAAPKVVIRPSVDDFVNSMQVSKLITMLGNVDPDLIVEEDRIYAIGSLQVEASYASRNGESEVFISRREFAILASVQKQVRATA